MKKFETLDAPLGAVDQGAVVGIAFGNIELTADHIVAGSGIAANVDALDIGPHALVDDEDDADRALLRVAVAARADRGEWIAVLGDFDGDVLHRFLDRVAVIDVARVHAQHRPQRQRIDCADVGLNLDRAETIERAFLDGKRDDEALDRRIVFADCGDDLHVGIAVGEIEAPDQIAIGFDAIGIVDVGSLQKAQEVRSRGLDHILEPIVGIGVIAGEDDVLDAGLLAFLDFENQVDAVVRPVDDFRHHLHVEASVAVIDLDDAGDVGLHHRLRQRAAGLRLDFLLELLVLDLRVALEGEPVDDRGLHHGHNQPAARLRNPDVLKQAGGVERFQRGVDLGGIEALARGDLEVRADGLGFDPAIAFDHDRGRAGLGLRMRSGCRKGRDRKQCYAEEQADHD